MSDKTWRITAIDEHGHYVMSNREVLELLARRLDHIIELLEVCREGGATNAEPTA